MSKKIKIGVLGCASIAERFMIPALMELSKFDLVGVASRTEKKANEFAEKFGIKTYVGYEKFINSNELDAVYIPLPNSLHYEWTKKALNNGLNVLIEKPMACEHKEVVELNNLAKQKRLALVESFQFRFHSQLKYIKDLVGAGKIGELRNIRSSFGFPPFPDGNKNIRYKKDLGGGALLDAGAYTVKIAQIFLENEIYVESANLVTPVNSEVDMWGCATLKQRHGELSSQVAFGFDNFYQNSVELWGSKGRIFTNRIFTAGPSVSPSVEVETNNGKDLIMLPRDHHFKNILNYFYLQITNKNNIDVEYMENINQSVLLRDMFQKSKK